MRRLIGKRKVIEIESDMPRTRRKYQGIICPHQGMINMIVKGATDEDSNQACKVYGQRLESYGIRTKIGRGPIISFGTKDLVGVTIPHANALVIQATIANYEVARIFMNIGSLVNIIFKDTFDQMQVDITELHYTSTTLFEFISHQVQPLGQISLPLSLGKSLVGELELLPFLW